jgi:thioredoxin 1
MAIFDTPITTNQQNLQKVLAQKLPVAVYLFRNKNQAVEDTLAQLAKANSGSLLIAKIDVNDNPGVHSQYGNPALPALITTSDNQVKTKVEVVTASDVRPHIDYLLGRATMPAAKAAPQPANGAQSNSQTAPVHINDASFQKAVMQSDVPVLVDFWAPWCGPCLSIAPYLEQVAKEFGGQVKIAKLNIDENPHIAQQFNVMSIPTFITFKAGKQIKRQSGANPALIRDMIQGALKA